MRLVALHPLEPTVVPLEATQIVHDDSIIVGRITSSRMSPTLDRSICLGRVTTELARANSVVTVRLPDGRQARAQVTAHHASFDVEGARLRG